MRTSLPLRFQARIAESFCPSTVTVRCLNRAEQHEHWSSWLSRTAVKFALPGQRVLAQASRQNFPSPLRAPPAPDHGYPVRRLLLG